MYRTSRILAAAVASLLCLNAAGQSFYGGLFSSPKGVGIDAEFHNWEDKFHSVQLYADIYGMPGGQSVRPGVMLNWNCNYILKTWQKENCDILFHMGPGISLGYVKDLKMENSPGAAFCLSGSIGWMFRFKRKISLNLSWTADVGMHIRQEPGYEGSKVALYKNGLALFPLPQLSIIRRF